MADGENRFESFNSSDDRFKYIGFEVFPGKPGDIFSSDEERKSLVQKVMAKFGHSEGMVREDCTLIQSRITGLEKGLLSFFAILLMVSIFLPWFSGHFEIVTERLVPVAGATQQDKSSSEPKEAGTAVDSTALTGAESKTPETPTPEATAENAVAMAAAGDSLMADSTMADSMASAAVADQEEVIPPGMTKIKEIKSDYRSMTGIGALFSLGTYGSMVFSSGFVLVISGILMILFFISCPLMAAFNLYLFYGVKKKTEDEYALYLKKMLKYNWYPLGLWLLAFILSFFGASYGFDSTNTVVQVGRSYGVGAFIGLSSVGIFVAIGSYLILALKGKEI